MSRHSNAQEILSPPVRHSVAGQASSRKRRHRNAQEILPPPARIVATAVLAVFVLIPIAYTLLLSVTPDTEIGGASLLPSHWAFSNYLQMWSTVNLALGLTNSLIIAGFASVISVVLAVGGGRLLL